jgi:hypothetical protein
MNWFPNKGNIPVSILQTKPLYFINISALLEFPVSIAEGSQIPVNF